MGYRRSAARFSRRRRRRPSGRSRRRSSGDLPLLRPPRCRALQASGRTLRMWWPDGPKRRRRPLARNNSSSCLPGPICMLAPCAPCPMHACRQHGPPRASPRALPLATRLSLRTLPRPPRMGCSSARVVGPPLARPPKPARPPRWLPPVRQPPPLRPLPPLRLPCPRPPALPLPPLPLPLVLPPPLPGRSSSGRSSSTTGSSSSNGHLRRAP